MKQIILLIPNIRSTFNVGSIFRTAEGFGIQNIVLGGYTPYPDLSLVNLSDSRLPHIRSKLTEQIHKTALGAERIVPFSYVPEINIEHWRAQGYRIVGLEQDQRSVALSDYKTTSDKIALVLGEEVHGLTTEQRAWCDDFVEIPMHGQKESFNVSVATGITLYALTLL